MLFHWVNVRFKKPSYPAAYRMRIESASEHRIGYNDYLRSGPGRLGLKNRVPDICGVFQRNR